MTIATSDAPAIENPSLGYKKGEVFGPVTQLRIYKPGSDISYCAHGDYCYPAGDFDLTSPCSFETSAAMDSDDITIYYAN